MVCDGARRRDCMGFSGVTARAGHWLAAQDSLDNRQTQMAVRIATLHRRQLPSDLLSIIGVEGGAQPDRIEPPERYRLMYRQLTWVVEFTTTMREKPIQRRMYWPVTEYEGSIPSRQAEPILLDPSDKSCFVGADGTGYEDLRVCVDGSMNAEEVDEWVVPEPKSRYPMRWHIGQWQRELKKGWTDIPHKWLERAPRRKAADVVAPTAEEAKLFIFDDVAFERMSELEGKAWAEREVNNIDEPNTFFDAKEAFGILRAMIGSGELSKTIRDPNTGQTRPILIGDITGSAGFVGSRDEIYVVLSDGQIALFGDTASSSKAAKARKVLRVV